MTATTLLGRTIRALGPKRAAQALGYSLGYVYALARDPADPEHPDNTGTERDPWTRLVALWEAVEARPHLQPLLHEWRLETDVLWARLIDHEDPPPATDAAMLAGAAAAAKESGEAVAAAIAGALKQGAWSDALREVMEAQVELQRLARAIRRQMEGAETP